MEDCEPVGDRPIDLGIPELLLTLCRRPPEEPPIPFQVSPNAASRVAMPALIAPLGAPTMSATPPAATRTAAISKT